jgi:hypothetical protein
MAKYKSLFKVSGDIGDINMYQREGQKYVRETTSLTKEKIMTDPRFRRTRENMMEFGGAGLVSKSLRVGLAAVAKRYGDSRMGARFLGIFKKMVRQANGVRGQRPIEPFNYRHLLEGKPLNRNIQLNSVITLPLDLQANVGRNGATLTLTQLETDRDLIAPTYATHFKVLLLVVGLSDHIYDQSIENYSPFTPEVNSSQMLSTSASYALAGLPPTTITLNADLPGLPTMSATEALVAFVGVEFYTEAGGNLYVLESGNAMDIVKVF